VLLGGTRIGPYEVVAQLGEGGMGVVYRALDTRLGREVALKVIGDRKLDDAGSIARFQQEARLAGALDHPNVLAVHDVGEHEGKPFLITELLEGESLGQRLASGPLAQHEALGIARQVALGLAAAHDKGILHRDLKPHNLFLTRDGRVKILDFGVAKIVSRRVECTISKGEPSARTATGGVIGTPAYMSPEQVRGQQLDGRSDLFSLGCVLYESLAGHRPFEGTTALEIGVAILNDAPPPLPLSVQKTVARLVLHCLEKRPEDRFQSAHELAIDLGALPDQVPLANAATELSGVQVPAVERTGDVSASAHPARRIRTVSWITAGLVVLAIAAAIAYRTGLRLRETVDRAAALPSIAVLPFSDLSPAKDQEYFSDGIAEELLNALAHVEGLRVVGRTSSFSFKGKTDDLPSRQAAAGTAVSNALCRHTTGRVR
jgi:serine/threonine protein kinase